MGKSKLGEREKEMILAVTRPGEKINTTAIAERISKRFGEQFSNRQLSGHISWSLSHIFKKERDPEGALMFTRRGGLNGVSLRR